MDLCWLDDQFLVSGSKDAKMCLWRINEEDINDTNHIDLEEGCPSFSRLTPTSIRECRAAQKVMMRMLYCNILKHD